MKPTPISIAIGASVPMAMIKIAGGHWEPPRTPAVQVLPSPQAQARAKALAALEAESNTPDPQATAESHISTARLKVWSMEDGADATQLLAMLAAVIGTPCDAGARQFGRDPAWVRQLHAALSTVRDMCLHGYRWNSAHAPTLDHALSLVSKHRPGLNPTHFLDAFIDANGLAASIERHTFTEDQIA